MGRIERLGTVTQRLADMRAQHIVSEEHVYEIKDNSEFKFVFEMIIEKRIKELIRINKGGLYKYRELIL
jgi:hypothetical protein